MVDAQIKISQTRQQRTSQLTGINQLAYLEEILVPFGVDVPMLHGVRDVGCLNEMFNYDGSLAVRLDDFIFLLVEIEVVIFTESNVPTGLSGSS